MSCQLSYIARTLTWVDPKLNDRLIPEAAVLQEFEQTPVVVLGDPGMGKTKLMQQLGTSEDCQFLRAANFLRRPVDTFQSANRLVIDGLDEVAAVEEGDPLHNVLKKLVSVGCPHFVISCRSAEWNSVTARIDIFEEYGSKPVELQLNPLRLEEATEALASVIGEQKAHKISYELESFGLAGLLANPLTLDFVCSIAKSDEPLPDTRAGLYDQAVNQLCLEQNKRYYASKLRKLSKEQALDTAGAIMAFMLLTGVEGVTTDVENDTALSISEISDFVDYDQCVALLGSRLFTRAAIQRDLFFPIHRTVAEFLGARWIGKTVESSSAPSRLSRRVSGVISKVAAVPASLRGLHAWLPKFSSNHLGPVAICSDPYGILRYGDGDNLDSAQSLLVIQQLKQLAAFDPYFRDNSWDSISLRGLAKEEHVELFANVLLNKEEPFHLRSILLEAVNGSRLARSLRVELETIMLDTDRSSRERFDVAKVLCRPDIECDWHGTLEVLLEHQEDGSTRLAVQLLTIIDLSLLTDEEIATIIVQDSKILNAKQDNERDLSLGYFYALAQCIPLKRIKYLLNEFVKLISPEETKLEDWYYDHYHDGWREFSDLVDQLINRICDKTPEVLVAGDLWNWLHFLKRHRYRSDDDTLSDPLGRSDNLRRAVQKLALFGPGTEDNFSSISSRLANISAGLALTESDYLHHLIELVARRNSLERQRWLALVDNFRSEGVIREDVQTIALPYAEGDEKLVEFLMKQAKERELSKWEIKRRQKTRARESQRKENFKKVRENFLTNISKVESGEFEFMVAPSQAYLGIFSDLDLDAAPDARVREWLGKEVCDAVLVGFEAVLHRSDLPSLTDIADSYAESRVWNFVYPMLAGVGQRFRKNKGFGDLPSDLLSSVAIAANHERVSRVKEFEGLKEAIHEYLQSDPVMFEAHSRQEFEPLFNAKQSYAPGLYQFLHGGSDLAKRLSLDWISTYKDIPLQIERELVGCVLDGFEESNSVVRKQLTSVSTGRLNRLDLSDEKRRFWLSLYFLLDFENALFLLPPITEENRSWLWAISEWFYSRYHEKGSSALRPSIHQLKWVVEAFRPVFPYTARPSGVTCGNRNPWDATNLLVWSVQKIAADPSVEATNALEDLIAMPRDKYTEIFQSSLATHIQVQVEDSYESPSVAELVSIFGDAPAKSHSDLQAMVVDELDFLQQRLKGDPLNLVNNFYDDNGVPRTENECRDQMLIALGQIPFGIKSHPEFSMPQGRRCDVGFVLEEIAIPLEAKGQWHDDVWHAPTTQLDEFYSIDFRAGLKGIYLVFWFGPDVPAGKRIKQPPDDISRPKSSQEMKVALETRLPVGRRSDVTIVVLDLSRP